jgi:predicted Ser/Thr protein kinase
MGGKHLGGDEPKLERLLRDVARPSVTYPPLLPIELADDFRFEVVRVLGAGGFGVVYLVRDRQTGAELALKTLAIDRPELVYRLKREFRTLADLRHPNLVRFHELFGEHGRCFFTMEYVDGPTFLEHVRAGGACDERRLRDALGQLARGLSALHSAGKLHRDVKPSNVLVTRTDGRVVLLDFGLASHIEESGAGRSADLAGTPAYMSPEHVEHRPLTAASDWYSVGVLLHQSLTGSLPFEGPSHEEAHRATAPSPATAWPEAPPDLVDVCSGLLRREPTLRAGASDVLAVSGSRAAAHPVEALAAPRLIGRDREVGRLRDARRRLDSGRGTTVLIEGSSGIGKTALVQRFLSDVEQEGGAVVLRGRCYERERVPYEGIDSLMDELCRFLRALGPSAERMLPRHVAALVRVFPVLERVPIVAALCRRERAAYPDEQELRSQAFASLRELLARIGDRQPLFIHVDDLQWGDLDAAALLKELLRPPDAPAMLVLLTYRSEDREVSPCVRTLLADVPGELERLEVPPLAPSAAEELARSLIGSELDQADAARLAADAGGNAFLIEEVARFIRRQRVMAPNAAVDLRAALRARIALLPAGARRLLNVIAVSGHPIPEGVARCAARVPAAAWDAFDPLIAEHLVRVAGAAGERQVEAIHDRVREAVVSSLDTERSTECHRGLADALEESGRADPEVLARHHAAAGNAERAYDFAVRAAEQAERALAFDRAARLFQWALDLPTSRSGEPRRLLVSLAGALANAGRGVHAAEVYLRAADRAEGDENANLRRLASQQLLLSGRIDEGRALATEALRAVGLDMPRTPRRALASLALHEALLRVRGLRFRQRSEAEIAPRRLALLDHFAAVNKGLGMVDVVRGAEFASRYLLLALATGEPRRVAHALAIKAGHSAAVAPRSRRTQKLFARLAAIAAPLHDPRITAYCLIANGLRADVLGRWRLTVRLMDAGERTFLTGCTGVAWEVWTARLLGGWALFHAGRWEELERRLSVYLPEAREHGNVYATTAMRVPYGIIAWLARGDLDGARSAARDAIANWSVRGFHLQHFWCLLAEVYLHLYSGEVDAGWRRIRAAWPDLARSLLLRAETVKVEMLHLRAGCAAAAALAAKADARRELLRDAARGARHLERVHSRISRPLALSIRAAVAVQLGRPDAERLLDTAAQSSPAQAWCRTPRPRAGISPGCAATSRLPSSCAGTASPTRTPSRGCSCPGSGASTGSAPRRRRSNLRGRAIRLPRTRSERVTDALDPVWTRIPAIHLTDPWRSGTNVTSIRTTPGRCPRHRPPPRRRGRSPPCCAPSSRCRRTDRSSRRSEVRSLRRSPYRRGRSPDRRTRRRPAGGGSP